MSGTTNSLVEIADYFSKANPEGASNVINLLHNTYRRHLPELFDKSDTQDRVRHLLDESSSNSTIIARAILTKWWKKRFFPKARS